jgi:3-phosphoshikimate 1-carboxyvinyltransferase
MDPVHAALPIPTRSGLASRLRVPGSKSITNRALLVAALAEGKSQLLGALDSDDTVVMRDALRALGARIETRTPTRWQVQGTGGCLMRPGEPLWLKNSGTAIRFLTAATTLGTGPFVIDGDARMRQRTIAPLVDALNGLGTEVEILGENGCPPVTVTGGGLPGGHVEIDASQSSQYVSAVLLAAPYAAQDTSIALRDGVLVSRPYIDTTLQVMADFGVEAGWDPKNSSCLQVPAGQSYQAREYEIEPDASAAVYPFCAAAIAGGSVRVEGLTRASLQADLAILDYLQQMGCRVETDLTGITVHGPDSALQGLGTVDLNELPDAAITLAVVATFANSPSRLENLANLRIKETDRLAALETEIQRLGGRATAGPDFLSIEPATLHGAEIETYEDHRIAMSFALAGLKVDGVVIRDPGCVSKTWPGFFETLESL